MNTKQRIKKYKNLIELASKNQSPRISKFKILDNHSKNTQKQSIQEGFNFEKNTYHKLSKQWEWKLLNIAYYFSEKYYNFIIDLSFGLQNTIYIGECKRRLSPLAFFQIQAYVSTLNAQNPLSETIYIPVLFTKYGLASEYANELKNELKKWIPCYSMNHFNRISHENLKGKKGYIVTLTTT